MPTDIRLQDPTAWFGSTDSQPNDARVADPAAWFSTEGSTPEQATAPNQALLTLGQLPGAAVDTVARVPGVIGGMIQRGMVGDVPTEGSPADPAVDARLMAGIQGQPMVDPARPTMDQFKLQTILANAGAAPAPTQTPRGFQTEAQKLGNNPTESILQGLSPRINSIAEKFAPEEVEAFRLQVGTPEALAMPEDRLRRFMALELGGQGGITSGAGSPQGQPGTIARNVQDFGQGVVSTGIRQPGAAVSAGIGAVLESGGSPRTAAPFFDNAREVGARNLPGDSVGGFVGQTVGSVAPSALAMTLGPAGPALIASYYGGQGYSTGYTMARDKAIQEGREPDPLEASLVGMGFVAVESITEKVGLDAVVARMPSLGVAVKAFQANPVGATAKGVLDEIGRLSAAGALEEGTSQFGQNVVQRGIDPAQKLGEGVPQAAAGGALGNLLLGGGQIARAGLSGGYAAATQNRAQRAIPPEALQAPETGQGVGGTEATTQAPPVEPGQAPPESEPVTPPTTWTAPVKTRTDREWAPRPPMTGQAVRGREGRLRLADGTDRQVTYDVVEAADLITTHNPLAEFAPDPAGDLNERPYQDPTEGKASRETVRKIADTLEPDLLLTDSPTPTDGPPITTEDLRILGGNARSMALKIAYSRGGPSAAKYRDALAARAQAYGIDPAAVQSMTAPVLVRRIAGDSGGRGELSRALNESLTTGKTRTTQAVSRGLLLEQADTDSIASAMGDVTMREALADPKRSASILQTMVSAGAISPSDLVAYRNEDGTLDESGKLIIEDALLGAAVGDVRTLAATSPKTRQKLLSALAPLTKLRRSRNSTQDAGIDFQQTITNALDLLVDMRDAQAKTIDELIEQGSMNAQEWRNDPRSIALARALRDDGPRVFAQKLGELATVAQDVGGGQEGFDFGQPKSPGEAFDQIFAVQAKVAGAPISRSGPDVGGQQGIFGQGNVSRATGRQRDLFNASEDAGMERQPGESDQDYRIRLRWGKPDVVKATGNLFGDRVSGAPARQKRRPRTAERRAQQAQQSDGSQRERVAAEMREAFGSDEILPVVDAYAAGWAKGTGKSVEDYYAGLRVVKRGQAGAMGSFEVSTSGQRIIRALTNPNASTLPHELAHDFLQNLPAMDPKLAERAAKALGVETHADIKTPQHEQFARGFEAYLRDGKAPSPNLRKTFERFRDWLIDIYESIVGTPLEGKLNPALKAVFDDMLTKGRSTQREAGAPTVGDTSQKVDITAPRTPRRAAGADPTPMKAGQKGEGTKLPQDRTVAQRPEDRPNAVARDLKEIRNARAQARRDGTLESLEPHRRGYRAIIEELASAFNLGRPGRKRDIRLAQSMLGYFRPLRADIRNRSSTDVQVAVHEIGHALAEMLLPDRVDRNRRGQENMDGIYPTAWRQELARMGMDLYGAKEPHNGYVDEGWAQFVAFLVTDTKKLKKDAPTVYRDVVQTLIKEHPGVWNALMRARERLGILRDIGSPVTPLMFNPAQQPGTRLQDKFSDAMIHWVDRHYRALDLVRDLGITPEADENPHIAALRMNGHVSGDVKTLIEVGGPWDIQDPTHVRRAMYENAAGEMEAIPSMREILKPVWGSLDVFREYMIAKRILEKRGQGFKVSSDAKDEDLASFVAKLEQREGFTKAAEQWQAFNEWLVRDYAVHHGLITAESAEQIIEKNQHYITFRYNDQFQDDRTVKGARRGGRFANQGKPFQYFKGGDTYEYLDPIGATFSNIVGVVSKARANQVAQHVVKLWSEDVPGIGRWMSKVQQPMQGSKIRGDQLGDNAARQTLGMLAASEEFTKDQLAMVAETFENMADTTFWAPKWVENDPRTHIAMVLVNGRRQYYEIKDRRLWEMLNRSSTGVEWQQLPGIVHDIMAGGATILRAGATSRNPTFFIPNYLRDQVTALIMSEADFKNLDQQTRRRLRGIKAAFVEGDLERAFLASGADMSGIAGDYFDRQTFELSERVLFRRLGMRDKAKAKGMGYAIKDAATSVALLEPFDRLNERIERMTRMQEFAAVLGNPNRAGAEGIARAGQAAADVTVDFAKGGTWAKAINQYVPFFNATIQGTDKFARFMRDNPAQAAAGIAALIIAPTVLQLILNDDNEDYWAKPYQFRDRFWFFPVADSKTGGKLYIRIPKPHVIGLFAVGVERAYAAARGIDPVTGKRGDARPTEGLAKTVFGQMTPPTAIAALGPILELSFNYNTFQDRPIVMEYERALPAEEQGYDRSSEFGRLVATMLADIDAGVSPIEVDHIVKGYTAGLGSAALAGMDPFIRAAWDDDMRPPQKPVKVEDYWMIRQFLSGATRGEHQAIRRFYDEAERVAAIRARYNQLSIEPDRQELYLTEHEADIALAPAFASARRRMGEINKARRILNAEPPQDADEHAKQDAELMQALVDVARATLELAPSDAGEDDAEE